MIATRKKEKPTQVLEKLPEGCKSHRQHRNHWRLPSLPDPGAKGGRKNKASSPFSPVAEFFDKGMTMGSGQAPVKKYNEYLPRFDCQWTRKNRAAL